MKFENYKLNADAGQIIEITYQDDVIDIHNACEFVKFENIVKEMRVILKWKYYFNYTESGTVQFQLVFDEVGYFSVEPRDNDMPVYEDECLEEISYSSGIIAFLFRGGMKIRIEALKTRIEIENTGP
ncbi:MAG: hypothetical protein K8F30_09485 [Taibaiella sp.]|nr:hypothetical protein [Taibaiella sp.]